MTTKILIYVEDGTVQYVNTNNMDCQIVVIDKDMQGKESGFISEPYSPDMIIENHYEGFTDQTDPTDMEIRDELKRMKF